MRFGQIFITNFTISEIFLLFFFRHFFAVKCGRPFRRLTRRVRSTMVNSIVEHDEQRRLEHLLKINLNLSSILNL
jgi:hypothetical protein